MRLASAKAFLAGLCLLPTLLIAADTPRLEQKDGRFALVVDGKPFLVLGAQINNSSAWPATLPNVWPALEAMHVNTVEAPVYWEQMEPEPGKFDFSNVDALLAGAARARPASGPALVRHLEEWAGSLHSGVDEERRQAYPRASRYGRCSHFLRFHQ